MIVVKQLSNCVVLSKHLFNELKGIMNTLYVNKKCLVKQKG